MSLRYTLTAPREQDAREVCVARLWAAGARGVWEDRQELVAWFDDRTEDVPRGGAWADEPERDWQAAWKAGIGPVAAGDVAVVPSWLRDEAPDVPHVIVLDPGQAFGTGHHATTVLCLELLQDLRLERARVLDVGTGTGVLAVAAARLGASHVRAVDIDPTAVAVAAQNATANDVEVELAIGSVGPADAERYDVVLANLLSETVTQLAGSLVGALAPGGHAIVSGITSVRMGGPRHALERAGAGIVREVHRDGWVGLTIERTRRHP